MQTKQAAGRKGKIKERGKEEKKNKDKKTNETAVLCTGDYSGHNISDDRAKVSIKISG